jgi:alpha-beta hydrolase superfamily lysophospholipase
VLVVPGEPGLPCAYLEALELLAANRAVSFYDPPCVGRSKAAGDAPPPDATPASLVDAVGVVARGLWPEADQRFHVVADGLGGLVVLDALAADPALRARVVSLTLLSTPASPVAGVAGRVARARALLDSATADAALAGDETAAAAFTSAAIVRRPAGGCVADARARADPAVAAALAGGAPLFALGGALAAWTPRTPDADAMPPTLLMYGEYGTVPPADAAALAGAVGGGTIVRVPAAGDWVAVDAAAEVVDAIEKGAEEAEGMGAAG